MNRFLAAVCVAGLTLPLSGCSSNADSLMKDLVGAYKDLADATEAKDSGKAEAATKRMTDINEQLKKMPPQEVQEAQKKYAPEIMAQVQRLALGQLGQMGDALKAMGKGGDMPALKLEFKQPGR